ncbi:MAG TPA: tRNA lysidine(34) synthetase TilS [Candidatus Omnitrophica bacterium]|nr:tRNA lysidine(34) synthetase TilS [Candidatus Omnitrophota bacterium]
MLSQVLKTIRKYRLFEPGDRVVLAVSGGPDSIALLYALKELNARLCLSFCVAHLDHNLRKNSARDRAFVEKAAGAEGLTFYCRTLDRKLIKETGHKEEALRRFRYDFLFSVAKKFRADKIVLAHHRDDQVETVLMRLLRGSGLYGMNAILPKRIIKGHVVVRPFLEVARADILGFLKKRRIGYVIDETNSEDRFLRNKIRNNLLPLLEKNYNPNIRETLSYFASSSGADYEFLSGLVEAFLKKNLKEKNRVLSLSLPSLAALDIALRRLVLRGVISRLKGDMRMITFKHAQEFEDLLFARPYFSEVHLPGRIVILKTKISVDFYISEKALI